MEVGDRVTAQYHRDNQRYPGILLEFQGEGRYLVSWDEPDDSEPLTTCTKVTLLKKGPKREPGNKQVFHVGDKVISRFDRDGGFYEAELLEFDEEKDTCTVKWDDPDGFEPIYKGPLHDVKLKLRVK